MSDTLPAAAPGLPAAPAFDRRGFLATLAAAGVLTGTSAAEAHADDALLALGVEMEQQREAWRIAGARVDVALALLPEEEFALPSVCGVITGDNIAWNPATASRFGAGLLWTDATMMRTYLRDTAGLAEPLAYFRDRATAIAEAIETRHATWDQERERLGLPAAEEAEQAARDAMDVILRQIAETPARTISGLFLKARAAAYAACDPDDEDAGYLSTLRASLTFNLRRLGEDVTPQPDYLEASLALDVLTMAIGAKEVA